MLDWIQRTGGDGTRCRAFNWFAFTFADKWAEKGDSFLACLVFLETPLLWILCSPVAIFILLAIQLKRIIIFTI